MDRITVTPQELGTAFTVWLKTVPAHLWRPYLKMLEIDRARRTDADRVEGSTPSAGDGEILSSLDLVVHRPLLFPMRPDNSR